MSAFGITGFGFFCLAVFALNLTPGPDTAYIVGRSVAQGRSAGLVSALGISLGACGHTLASAFGLSALLMTSATAFTVIKIAGSVYLVYLGLRMLWSTPAAPKAGSGNLQPAAAHPSAAPLADPHFLASSHHQPAQSESGVVFPVLLSAVRDA